MSTVAASLNLAEPGPVVNPNIYGHFAEHLGRGIYEGLWVGEESDIPNVRGIRTDVVEALKALNIPVLRWPGGCFADEYHWKDGIGPRENRPSMINTHWGGVVENNHFGTHEFFDLCEQLETSAYVCGNVGSGTVQEMMEWVEYMTSPASSPMANLRRANGRPDPWRLPYFGVGNENWGCGGNMRAEYYADEYRRYNTFVKTYAGQKIYRIAGGANSKDYHWTEVLMERAASQMDGLSLHNYTLVGGTWPPSGSASNFEEEDWFSLIKHACWMDELISNHAGIMDRFDEEKRVGMIVDEWGTWLASEPGSVPGFLYQQNALRDAIVAGIHFHIFHRHADRVQMANIAQTVNVLQAMILTDGPRILRTPTYWVFEMFKVHQGGTTVPVTFESPTYTFESDSLKAVSISATRRDDGYLDVSFVNLDPHHGFDLSVQIGGEGSVVEARVLSAPTMQAINTFDEPDSVIPTALDATFADGQLSLNLPAKSVAIVTLKLTS